MNHDESVKLIVEEFKQIPGPPAQNQKISGQGRLKGLRYEVESQEKFSGFRQC
jgi:hypothetical protein